MLKADVIIASTDNLSTLNLARESHLDDENLGIGDDTWTFVVELESECDTKPFYTAVRMFYVATIRKMLKKFPLGDSLLKDLGIINPELVSSYSASTVIKLGKIFPQVGLSDTHSLDKLREEFMDFSLSPADHPLWKNTYQLTRL